jgi:glycosyltransferase involved in cell wall biosynthesis
MKIIRIIARLNVGGPARHVVWLSRAFRENEFESLLVAGRVPAGEEDMAYLAEANGVKPVFIEEMSRELSVKDVVSLVKIFRLIRREKPDIVHTHTAKAGTVGRSAAFLYRWLTPGTLVGRPRPLVVVHTFHGHVFHSYYGKFKTSIFILIEKLLARFATDRIVVISEQQFDEIHRQVGIGKAKQFATIPLGIDLEPFAAAGSQRNAIRDELAIEVSTLLIGIVGRLTEIKNISLYLKVAQQYENLDDPSLPQLHFVVAGDGHLRPALEAEARELGVRNLKFLGNRDEIEKVYAGLDVVALTSLNEGTPLSLLEAMASRKPVISTTVGGVVDLLGPVNERHEGFAVCERGISVEPRNADAFLKGLIYLVKNERLREELSNNGHDFVRENYGKDRLIEDIGRLYRELSDGDT